jgi:hypothetical protein
VRDVILEDVFVVEDPRRIRQHRECGGSTCEVRERRGGKRVLTPSGSRSCSPSFAPPVLLRRLRAQSFLFIVHRAQQHRQCPLSPPRTPAASSPKRTRSVVFSRCYSTLTRLFQAIRRKIEAELARKRTISTTHPASRGSKRPPKAIGGKGTVAALRPSPALTVPESITVSDASQLCAAKRTDCVLVVDDDEGLSGIFTAKDLAYRVRAISPAMRTASFIWAIC